jgi:hypothetical protein
MFVIKLETRHIDSYYNADTKTFTLSPEPAKKYTTRNQADKDKAEAEQGGGFAMVKNYEKEAQEYWKEFNAEHNS